jgi:hypothetical protein
LLYDHRIAFRTLIMYWQTQDILIFFPKVILQTPFAFIILFNILGHLTTVNYLIMHSVGSQLGLCIIRSYALSDVSHFFVCLICWLGCKNSLIVLYILHGHDANRAL